MQLGLLFGFWKSYMLKALVLSSGGVDSTTCLALAVDKLGAENVSSVSIFYGQKHQKELLQAKKIADYYKVNHYELDLSAMFAQSNCALLKNSTQEIEESTYKEQITAHGKVNTYVPFRNGLFLASVASLAGSIYPLLRRSRRRCRYECLCRLLNGIYRGDESGNFHRNIFAGKYCCAICRKNQSRCGCLRFKTRSAL